MTLTNVPRAPSIYWILWYPHYKLAWKQNYKLNDTELYSQDGCHPKVYKQ